MLTAPFDLHSFLRTGTNTGDTVLEGLVSRHRLTGRTENLFGRQRPVVEVQIVDQAVKVITRPPIKADLERVVVRRIDGLLPIHGEHAIGVDLGVRAVMDVSEVDPLIGSIVGEVEIATPVLDSPGVLGVQGTQGEILSGRAGADIVDGAVVRAPTS